MTVLLCVAVLLADPTPPEGVRPVGADGRLLNLDFEAGTLQDWTADGEAFAGQPVQGDTVFTRRGDMRSLHQGRFWVGGFERHGDKPTGTLTSAAFRVTHPWASFLVAGGDHETETCVELLLADGTVVARAAGDESETLKRVAVDLTPHVGKELRVRLVDRHTGHWGHLNFDDFRFHATKPAVPERLSTKADDYRFSGQPPAEAAKNMTVPPGFSVSLFAGEPDLHQPVGFCLDHRGRLWVAEAYCYPRRKPFPGPLLPEAERKHGDKILIFEDVDGDGRFDKRTVFLEGLNLVSGIEWGFGGLWVGAAPYLLYVPIDGSGDKPAGEPQVLLDGWGYQDTHETLNSFVWGPDGWLYGCHGVFTHSRVGKPGTPDADRVPINAGVWRYHPTRHTFEVFAHGTSNPWGLDFNRHGDFFAEACVIPHLWHIVPGGRYERQAGQHFNPHTYTVIPTIAKHRHYAGANPHAGNGRSDSAGGGHAHSGLLCYQGGAWPKEYDGKLLMGNIHGHRLNVDAVTPKGSSYEGDRNPDFLLSHDKACLIVGLQAAPDGNVYFCDWSDKQACHRNEPEVWDRTNGRIFKVSHKDSKPVRGLDVGKLPDAELVALQTSPNDWMARHARRVLQERAAGRKRGDGSEVRVELLKLLEKHADPGVRLRALWALHAVGEPVKTFLKAMVDPTSEHVRAWAVQLALESDRPGFLALDASFHAVNADRSPVVRRAIASALLRQPADSPLRRDVAGHLLGQPTAGDPLLPHLVWYAAEPLAAVDAAAALRLAAGGSGELLPQMARRVGAVGTPAAAAALVAAADAAPPGRLGAYVAGFQELVKGKRRVEPPAGWAAVSAKLAANSDASVRAGGERLGVTFGDPAALARVRTTLGDPKAPAAGRLSALSALQDVRDPQLPAELLQLLADPALRGPAIKALAAFDHPETPKAVLAAYPSLTTGEKRDAVATLAARPAFARALLAAVESKAVPASDLQAEAVRQLRSLNDPEVSAKLQAVWGVVRDTPADRKKLIADWGKKLSPAALAKADLGAGRAVFARVCQQCHTLYAVGGKVGPDITGANRADLGYLLENIFDPSAVIPKEYAATKLELADGRVVVGIVRDETAGVLTVQTANEVLGIPAKEVDRRTPSDLSMMPADVTGPLSDKEVRDLFAYLKHPQQVPQLADPESGKALFNGRDLVGWDGDPAVWRVENGEIVGRTTTGLKQNSFLRAPLDVADFRLSFQVKLLPDGANSGVQFRSVAVPGGEMRGPQADIGQGWWGKLYEESGRGLLSAAGGERFVKPGEWTDYVIEATGDRVRLLLNGQVCADHGPDPKLARRGQIAFQVHSGGPTEVRFRAIRLEVAAGK